MRKIIALIILFYILSLVQASFLIHFSVKGVIPNLVLIAVVLLNFLFYSRPAIKKEIAAHGNIGLWGALFAGIFLDLFSGLFFGAITILLLIIALIIKGASQMSQGTNIFVFLLFLIIAIVLYNFGLGLISYFLESPFLESYCFDWHKLDKLLVEIIYSLFLSIPIFYIVRLNGFFSFSFIKRHKR